MNSTAVVLMIITVLTYGIVCIGKRMELMDAVTVSFAVLLAVSSDPFCVHSFYYVWQVWCMWLQCISNRKMTS